MRTALLALALLLTGSALQAQETTIQPGDTLTLTVIAAEVPPDTVLIPSPPDTVEVCPVDWTCTPPLGPYVITVSATRNDMSGELTAPEGMLFVNLERRDGTWTGSPFEPIAGVDSVVFVLDGARNRERSYPYEVGGGPIPLAVGLHELTWKVFGLEPDAGTATLTVTVTVSFRIPDPILMGPGLMVQVSFPLDDVRDVEGYTATLNGEPGTQQTGGLGWYWLPAPDTGEIIVSGAGQTWSRIYD